MKVEVEGIDWDAGLDLPSSVTMEVADDVTDDDIIEELSDEYGWCINGVERIVRC